MVKKDDPKEVLDKKLKDKEVYVYVYDDIRVKSKEVSDKDDTITHYPFNKIDGGQKYKFINRIVFHRIHPADVRGVFKKWKSGYGFTKNLTPIISYFADHMPGIGEIVISSELKTKLEPTKVVFNFVDLDRIFSIIRPVRDKHREELKALSSSLLASLFPGKIKKKIEKYSKGELQGLIKSRGITTTQLSDEDIGAISELISSIPIEHSFVKSGAIVSAKTKIDEIYLEAVLEEFSKLMTQKRWSGKLEEKWHRFFKENSWILSQALALPIVILKDKAFVGGKSIFNTGGKIGDFLYKNKLTNNIAIIEIKTHRDPLLDKTSYRGDDVFTASKALSGAVVQVLDQKENLQKEFYSLSKGGTVFESFNPPCVVLVGQVSDLEKEQLKSFELFRGNSKEVLILTFDELFYRLGYLLDIFRKK